MTSEKDKNDRGRPKGPTPETRRRVISSLRSAIPGAMSRYAIRDRTGVHPRILEDLLLEFAKEGWIERISISGNREVFRWIGD